MVHLLCLSSKLGLQCPSSDNLLGWSDWGLLSESGELSVIWVDECSGDLLGLVCLLLLKCLSSGNNLLWLFILGCGCLLIYNKKHRFKSRETKELLVSCAWFHDACDNHTMCICLFVFNFEKNKFFVEVNLFVVNKMKVQ